MGVLGLSKTEGQRKVRPKIAGELLARQRQVRLMLAAATAAAQAGGYRDASVSTIVKAAGTSRKTFYDAFSGKDEVMKAALVFAADRLLRRAKEGAPDGVFGSLEAVVREMVETPDMARLLLLEGYGINAVAVAAQNARFAALLPHEPMKAELVIGGVAHLLRKQVHEGDYEGLPDLIPDLHDFIVGAR
jgi:AcrR family transcriptional regulator